MYLVLFLLFFLIKNGLTVLRQQVHHCFSLCPKTSIAGGKGLGALAGQQISSADATFTFFLSKHRGFFSGNVLDLV